MIEKIFGFSGVTQYVLIGSFVLILTMAGAGLWYFNYSQEKIEIMAGNIKTLEADNKAVKERLNNQKNAIDNALAIHEENRTNLRTLSKELRDISEASRELSQLYREHDLNQLANAKPKMIEKRINDATKELFDELESITAD